MFPAKLSPVESTLDALQARLQRIKLPVAIKLWNNRLLVGDAPVRVTISLNTPQTLSLFVRPDISRFAEYYVQKKIDLEGNVRDIVSMLAPLLEISGKAESKLATVAHLFRHTRSRDKQAIQFHYDVSDDFYALWLDRRRVYSCAYFKTEQDSLDLAQEQKLDLICRKLAIKQDERVLDIGCGWGGMIFWAAEKYGANCTGITLSENQRDYVQQQIVARGLEGKVEVRLQDYRDVPEENIFDKIISVGMVEHVGTRNLGEYFNKINRLLKPGGLLMNHGVTSSTMDNDYIRGGGADFIQRYVFPEGELAHVSKVLDAMGREKLECLDVENLRPHYAETLWHWVERLEAQQQQAVEIVGEEKYRIWRAYMAGFAYAFEQGWDAIYQVVAAKPLKDGSVPTYPFTRDYMYQAPLPPFQGGGSLSS
ncbi:MAG: cyclopropane-fatty-acyl-phospholipid synthase family protein [Burkholderiales bacterium]